jgi:hypothetical protein
LAAFAGAAAPGFFCDVGSCSSCAGGATTDARFLRWPVARMPRRWPRSSGSLVLRSGTVAAEGGAAVDAFPAGVGGWREPAMHNRPAHVGKCRCSGRKPSTGLG